MCFPKSMEILRKPQQTNESPKWSRSSQSSQQMPSQSRISPCALYNSFYFRQPHRTLQPTTKQQQREAASLSKVLQPSSFTMPFATTSGGYRVIQRKLCPWWRRTDVIKAVSCCRARKPSPTTWNYLNHAPASRKGGKESVEMTKKAKPKWGFNPFERRVPIQGTIKTTIRHIYANA